MNQAFHLYRLQQIDTQISQVESQLVELDRLLAGDEAIQQARSLVEEKNKAHQKARQKLKEAEFAVRDQNLKIEQNESTLYSGKVRNPKELQDLQKELASLKKHLAHLEDEQLEAMVAVEEAEQAEIASQNELNTLQAVFTEKSAGWKGQRVQVAKNRARLLAERAAALPPISPDSLKIYDRLRQRKSGVGVTSVRDGSCSVCGAAIRPAEVQSARASQELVFCSSCGRILYTG